jgi:hypothetical protein
MSSAWSRFKRDARIAWANWRGASNGPQDVTWIYGYDAGRVPAQ